MKVCATGVLHYFQNDNELVQKNLLVLYTLEKPTDFIIYRLFLV